MTAEQIAADVAARIRAADQQAEDAAAAFACGRGEDYLRLQAAAIVQKMEAAGDAAIADARSG